MRTIIILLILLGLRFDSVAQADSVRWESHTVPNLRYFGSYFTDLAKTTVAPLKWKYKQWMTFGAVGAGTLLVMTNDLRIQQVVTSNTTTLTNKATKNLFEPTGNYQYVLGTAALAYSLGLITGKDRHKQAGLLAVKSYVISGILVQVLKQLGSRKRPYQFNGDPNPYKWTGFSLKYNSFPSGHTTAAFSVASVYATIYKDVPVVGIVAYSMASLAGLSRIHDNKHWASDVIAGAALGTSIGYFLVKKTERRINAVPFSDGRSAGINIQYQF